MNNGYDTATGLYLHLCRLPKEERIKFLNWVRDYIKKIDNKQKIKEKQNEQEQENNQ